uniref:Secreted protein n=1 Tax=Daphnia galeata TaxID=27404 RepID=A0A8J2WFT2_9CRUS|nr:unnamed protein product [Daphnia galeata]
MARFHLVILLAVLVSYCASQNDYEGGLHLKNVKPIWGNFASRFTEASTRASSCSLGSKPCSCASGTGTCSCVSTAPYRALFLYQWNLCHQFGNRYRNRDIYQYFYYLQ